VLILTRDDITSVSFAADAAHSAGKYEACYAGKDGNVERKYLKSHRYHEQNARGCQDCSRRFRLMVRQVWSPDLGLAGSAGILAA